jgi:undecaprenyl diphosphate synthase
MTANQSNSCITLPQHIAVIMDGNGRWARAHGRPRHAGHRAGVKATREIVEAAAQRGVRVLTLFAFSSENWKRPIDEVSSLMSLFVEVLKREVKSLDENGIRVRFIGAREKLSLRLQGMLANAEEQTKTNDRMELVLAVAYGGRWDIVEATRQVAADVQAGKLKAEDISEQHLASHLSLAGIVPPDLLIRTGGEKRISNFLLWDIAYSELYFTPTLWPDFSAVDLEKALAFYAQRERRFGETSEQVVARVERI